MPGFVVGAAIGVLILCLRGYFVLVCLHLRVCVRVLAHRCVWACARECVCVSVHSHARHAARAYVHP